MFKFLKAARSLVNQGMSKEAIEQFAKQEFGEINELFQKQIDNLFKQKQGIENIKIKDEVFDDTVIKLPIDDTGVPFNPKDPLKQYGIKGLKTLT
jgi:glucose-6-phosphate-specific signal transduction histidine kinase